jgi:hypothetical protein
VSDGRSPVSAGKGEWARRNVAERLDGWHKAADEPGRAKHPGYPARYVKQTEAQAGSVASGRVDPVAAAVRCRRNLLRSWT